MVNWGRTPESDSEQENNIYAISTVLVLASLIVGSFFGYQYGYSEGERTGSARAKATYTTIESIEIAIPAGAIDATAAESFVIESVLIIYEKGEQIVFKPAIGGLMPYVSAYPRGMNREEKPNAESTP